MITKEVNARNWECPKPVIETKKALDSIAEGHVITTVDNEIAKENVLRLAQKMDFVTEVKNLADASYEITINKNGNQGDKIMPQAESFRPNPNNISDKWNLVVPSPVLGTGNDELGDLLIKSFFYALANNDNKPEKIAFLNGGVHLVCTDSPALESIMELADEGVEILACGTCLDFYGNKDQLQIGIVSNMYDILEVINAPGNTVVL